MARFIVEAVSSEYQGDVLETLPIGVSVSRADDGAPVTGLTADNFRITAAAAGLRWRGRDRSLALACDRPSGPFR